MAQQGSVWVGCDRFLHWFRQLKLTGTVWTPEPGAAALHLHLPVALKGAAVDGQLQAGGAHVEPADREVLS